MQKEQVLDCLVCAMDNVHPDNWVEDVGDMEYELTDQELGQDPQYGYNSTADLDWLRETNIIS